MHTHTYTYAHALIHIHTHTNSPSSRLLQFRVCPAGVAGGFWRAAAGAGGGWTLRPGGVCKEVLQTTWQGVRHTVSHTHTHTLTNTLSRTHLNHNVLCCLRGSLKNKNKDSRDPFEMVRFSKVPSSRTFRNIPFIELHNDLIHDCVWYSYLACMYCWCVCMCVCVWCVCVTGPTV